VVLRALEAGGQVALRYADNVNGSEAAIAGICDASGRIFGLMPHPERYLDWTRHPFWTRLEPSVRSGDTPGLAIFRNAVRAAEQVAA
jgi:phosphoribosylformylglycinamidine synthase